MLHKQLHTRFDSDGALTLSVSRDDYKFAAIKREFNREMMVLLSNLRNRRVRHLSLDSYLNAVRNPYVAAREVAWLSWLVYRQQPLWNYNIGEAVRLMPHPWHYIQPGAQWERWRNAYAGHMRANSMMIIRAVHGGQLVFLVLRTGDNRLRTRLLDECTLTLLKILFVRLKSRNKWVIAEVCDALMRWIVLGMQKVQDEADAQYSAALSMLPQVAMQMLGSVH